jgi:hypothetical protein
MSDEVQRVFVKPPDFASVYADGVMFQKSGRLCRLIFYQRGIEPNEDGSAMDKNTEYIKLNFEVRLPETTLGELAENITEILELDDKAWRMYKRHKRDEKVMHSWFNLTESIEQFLYNTDEDEIDSKSVQDMNDQYDDLQGRTSRRSKAKKNEPDQVS